MALPFDRFLNLIFAFATENINDEQEYDRFVMRLNLPIPGIFSAVTETASPWSAESETSALSSLAATLRGGGS